MNASPVLSSRSIASQINEVMVETAKKFDDAIYRKKTGDTLTAADLWIELKKAQSEPGMAAGMKCMGILNQLARRKQIPADWNR